MKKTLLGATALSMIAMAGFASAQEWTLDIGGGVTAGIGYVDADAHDAEVELVNNGEIHFNFQIVADNGITFGSIVEIEANGTSENADEYYAFVSGSFGRVEIGRQDGVHDRLAGEIPSTNFTNAADGTGFLFDYADPEVGLGLDSEGANSGDDFKIIYLTPRFSGFQAGVSYTPSSDTSTGRTLGQGGTSSIGSQDDEVIEVGANYRGEFGDFSVELGAGYSMFQDETGTSRADLDQAYSFLGVVGFAGFKLGAQYGTTEFSNGDADEEQIGVGATYETGPWAFGLTYAQVLDGSNEDNYGVGAGVDYALAPGVTAGLVVEYGEVENPAPGEDDDALAVGVLTRFDF